MTAPVRGGADRDFRDFRGVEAGDGIGVGVAAADGGGAEGVPGPRGLGAGGAAGTGDGAAGAGVVGCPVSRSSCDRVGSRGAGAVGELVGRPGAGAGCGDGLAGAGMPGEGVPGSYTPAAGRLAGGVPPPATGVTLDGEDGSGVAILADGLSVVGCGGKVVDEAAAGVRPALPRMSNADLLGRLVGGELSTRLVLRAAVGVDGCPLRADAEAGVFLDGTAS